MRRAYVGGGDAAAQGGVDIRGCLIWALLDKLEWDSGYSIRFGLVYVDYASLRRIPKASFDWYAGLIKAAHQR